VFYDDRVELCGITVCGGKNSSIKRRVLEILREQTKQGTIAVFNQEYRRPFEVGPAGSRGRSRG